MRTPRAPPITGQSTERSRTTAGKYGSALTFDGVNDLVTVPDSNTLDLTNGMTLEAWVRPSQNGNFRTAILKETPATWSTGSIRRRPTAAGRRIAARPPWISATDVGATSALPLNAWSRLAVTYDRTAMRLYINGTLSGSVTGDGHRLLFRNGYHSLRLGAQVSAARAALFNGRIDEARIYNRDAALLKPGRT